MTDTAHDSALKRGDLPVVRDPVEFPIPDRVSNKAAPLESRGRLEGLRLRLRKTGFFRPVLKPSYPAFRVPSVVLYAQQILAIGEVFQKKKGHL